MDKTECEDRFSESETEEHVSGKKDLYEWIRKQPGVTNAVLEAWIPETKQRPDIMFEYVGKKVVIEYQCSPIATEYVERHDLYKTAGIIDIWLCGTDKYLKSTFKTKYIQDNSYGFYSPKTKMMIPIEKYDNEVIHRITIEKMNYHHSEEEFTGFPLKYYVFNGNIYNFKLGSPNEVRKKRIQRKEREKQLIQERQKKNFYLNKQYNKYWELFKNMLYSLSNQNWRFFTTYPNGRRWNYINAEPIINDDVDHCIYYESIWIETFGKEEIIKCAKNIEYLKQILLPIMKTNYERALSFKSDKVRVLEVCY